jgi:zinc transport system permease protein
MTGADAPTGVPAWDEAVGLLTDPLMQRALLAALLVGLVAPVVGTYLVQRRLSLLGDGIGHVALTGVALGWLVAGALELAPRDALALPGAVVAALAGAILIEIVSERGTTNGDVVLALLFYGGIAGGVLLIGLAGGTSANLTAYLFGSISTVTAADLAFTAVLALLILGVGVGLRTALFTVSQDPEYARSTGLPVRGLNILVAVVAALTVTVAMRVVGVLLVSALMIVPVAIAQMVATSFRTTMTLAMGIGTAVSVTGLTVTYWQDVSPGATIVVLAIAVYALVAIARGLIRWPRGRTQDAHRQPVGDVARAEGG